MTHIPTAQRIWVPNFLIRAFTFVFIHLPWASVLHSQLGGMHLSHFVRPMIKATIGRWGGTGSTKKEEIWNGAWKRPTAIKNPFTRSLARSVVVRSGWPLGRRSCAMCIGAFDLLTSQRHVRHALPPRLSVSWTCRSRALWGRRNGNYKRQKKPSNLNLNLVPHYSG